MVTNNPYESQPPSQAYTRWLAQQQEGRSYSAPIRRLLEARGRTQSALAPLFGFGIDQAVGGQGRDFASFYAGNQGRVPSWTEIQRQLQGVQAALSAGERATAYQQILAGNYQDPANQLEALQAGYSRALPALRTGLSRQLARRFQNQQAVSPNESFFDYASRQGWF